MVSEDDIAKIKSNLDIVTLVSEYVPSLKNKGRNHFGLCPFHNESTPSFSVNPELGIFKCFGCGEGGDQISFLQKIEGLDFPEALKLAAEKAGVKIKEDNNFDPTFKNKQERAFEAYEISAQYYHYLLMEHKSGEEAREYAKNQRKLKEHLLVDFQLGYAPKGFHNLHNFLLKKKFTEIELIEFGLLVKKNNYIYDKFRNRLMHPIKDARGRVIGFSGRIIDKDSKGPKYLNSPETIIYQKKKSLYGLFEAKESIRRINSVILVEGNLDVVSSHKVKIQNITCPLGTALTPEQLKLIKRYTNKVLFAFDSDNAGRKALLRGLELCEKEEIEAYAIDIDTKDVDDLVNSEPEKWVKLVNNPVEIPSFIMRKYSSDYDLSNASDINNFLKLVFTFLKPVENEIKLDHYLQELERICGTKYDILVKKLNEDKQSKNSVVSFDPPKNQSNTPDKSAPKKDLPKYKLSIKFKYFLNYLYEWSDLIVIDDLTILREFNQFLPSEQLSLIRELMRQNDSLSSETKSILSELRVEKKYTPPKIEGKESATQILNNLLKDIILEILKLSMRQRKTNDSSELIETHRKALIKLRN